ncbi:PEP-CTERM sorting domain-containing protein [Pontixanthobacter sp. CEM42]|uniref:PEP-CTERM sorting domain-containing protein n=1 Tax=Pontixanthobacter sp. CEM42 TaxID=2792077 RepID=UPI001ADFDE01|nr:PEP-CTERM sorting domain-containing protein [Pontixanthobacter sp. CEM42]
MVSWTRNIALAAAAPVALMAVAAPASASTIDYDVSDATDSGCSHGLWTNSVGSGCDRRYSFQDGTKFTQDTDAGTATFTGTAVNGSGKVAKLDLSFSGFQDALNSNQGYKAGGGAYNPSTMDFYSSAAGTITIGGKKFTINPRDPLAGNTTVQIGPGANDKTGDFGGSAWLNILNPNGWSLPHWDINFDLAHTPGTPVPAPGGAALFGLALIGLWAGRRRRSIAAA